MIIIRSIQHQLQEGTCQPGKPFLYSVESFVSLIVVCFILYCTNWVTALGVKSYQKSQSRSQKLCKLHPAERSIDLVSTHYKGCNQGQKGHSYQISKATSGVITNFLCPVSEQNQLLVVPIWNKLLLGSATDLCWT